MRRYLLTAAVAACSVGFAAADDEKGKAKAVPLTPIQTKGADDKKAEDKKADDEKKETTRREKLTQIQKDLNAKRAELAKEINAMKPGKERDDAIQGFNAAGAPFAQKALELAKEDIKDAACFPAAMFAYQMGGGKKVSSDAGEFLIDHFADDLKMMTAIPALAQGDAGAVLLGKLAEKAKSPETKGTVLFTLAETEVDNADYPRTGKPLPADEAAAKFAALSQKLAKIGTEFKDVKHTGRLGKTIGEAAAKKQYFIDNLTIGKTAPDFQCEVLDGDKKVKFSEVSKGHVTVLDVWATWCGPCKAMIPHERELVEKLKSKPFKLVSLSADDKKETLTKFLETEEMPWTHLWNGSAKGNFLEQYQIRFYPTIYVLDAKGVIRFKHVRGAKMDEAVETLLKEMTGAE